MDIQFTYHTIEGFGFCLFFNPYLWIFFPLILTEGGREEGGSGGVGTRRNIDLRETPQTLTRAGIEPVMLWCLG